METIFTFQINNIFSFKYLSSCNIKMDHGYYKVKKVDIKDKIARIIFLNRYLKKKSNKCL